MNKIPIIIYPSESEVKVLNVLIVAMSLQLRIMLQYLSVSRLIIKLNMINYKVAIVILLMANDAFIIVNSIKNG